MIYTHCFCHLSLIVTELFGKSFFVHHRSILEKTGLTVIFYWNLTVLQRVESSLGKFIEPKRIKYLGESGERRVWVRRQEPELRLVHRNRCHTIPFELSRVFVSFVMMNK